MIVVRLWLEEGVPLLISGRWEVQVICMNIVLIMDMLLDVWANVHSVCKNVFVFRHLIGRVEHVVSHHVTVLKPDCLSSSCTCQC